MSVDHNSEALIKTVDVQQSAIARMSAFSSTAKNWCITITSGIVIVAFDKKRAELFLVAVVPILLFAVIDIYYLSLERRIRSHYESLVSKIHKQTVELSDLFEVNPGPLEMSDTKSALSSTSIWPFYGFLIAVLFGAYLCF